MQITTTNRLLVIFNKKKHILIMKNISFNFLFIDHKKCSFNKGVQLIKLLLNSFKKIQDGKQFYYRYCVFVH